jgi:hypothetical protein
MFLDIFKHKDIPLYVVDIPWGLDDVHREYFTRIPWGEYKRIRYAERHNSVSNYDLKIKIFRDYSVRDPKWSDEEIDILPAGIIDTIANLIMHVSDSGIIPDSEGKINIPAFNHRLNMYRGIAATNVEYQMYTVICMVFKAYTFEMLDKLPFDKIASLFASAERHLLENGILKEPLQVYDPQETKPGTKTSKAPEKKTKKDSGEESMLELYLKKQQQEAAEADEESFSAYITQRDKEKTEQKVKPPVKVSNNVEYIAPKDNVVVSNGVQVKVPGIAIDHNKTVGGGFTEEDFSTLPMMTPDQALAAQIEMGLVPAGYDLYMERVAKNKQEIQTQENVNKKFGKKTFKRK